MKLPFQGLLARSAGARRYAAVAGPNGVHMVEYTRERGELVLDAGIRQTAPGDDPETLAAALADAVEALGGRGGELALALSGFGTAHHILTLPVADPAILGPIVRRELLRYYPDLDDPEVGFVLAAEAEGSDGPSRELLVGAAPRGLAGTLSRALRERGIVLHHLTVMPQVLQKLFEAFDGAAAPTVAVLVLETGTLIGCFYRGALRLFIEPRQDVHGRPLRDPASVREQVERANLFLRQQFPGVTVDRVLLAAPDGEFEAVRGELARELESDVVRLADVPAGSLAALGAALAAESESGLDVLPAAVRPRTPAQRLTRRLAVVAAGLVVAAATWWAGSGIGVARAQADEARDLERQVSSVLPELNRAGEVLESRRDHRNRLRFLSETTGAGAEVRRVLAAASAAAGPLVTLTGLTVEREGDGWRVELAGMSESASSAAAVRAVDTLYRGLMDRLPVRDGELGELEGVAGEAGAPVAIGFDMSFIVQWQTDLAR